MVALICCFSLPNGKIGRYISFEMGIVNKVRESLFEFLSMLEQGGLKDNISRFKDSKILSSFLKNPFRT